MDLVSLNVRGAVGALASYVRPFDAYMSWARHGFFHSDYDEPRVLRDNPNLFDSFEIFSQLSKSVRWTDQEQAARGLRALSQFARMADYETWNDEAEFRRLFHDLELACMEDGFIFDHDSRTISQREAVPLDELNLAGITTTSGIKRKLKKLNRALVQDRDNLEIIGLSKDLMEATASAILIELGNDPQRVNSMKAAERCSHAMKSLGITKDNGAGKVAEGFTLMRKAANKLVEGITEMRRDDTDEGHGTAEVKQVTNSQANLAFSSSLAWCHFILDNYHESNKPPF